MPSDGQYASHTDWPEVERDHAAVITYLDGYVGDLLALLKKLQIEEKTLVFFASDNGAHLEGGHSYHFFNSTGGLLGHKRSLFEGGYRSPTMVRWPAAVAPAVSDVPFAFWDVIPTLVELIGADEPAALLLLALLCALRITRRCCRRWIDRADGRNGHNYFFSSGTEISVLFTSTSLRILGINVCLFGRGYQILSPISELNY